MAERTHDGRAFRILNILDEYTRECLDSTVERNITTHQVIERLAHLFITKGIPDHIRDLPPNNRSR
jgi:putative transposase